MANGGYGNLLKERWVTRKYADKANGGYTVVRNRLFPIFRPRVVSAGVAEAASATESLVVTGGSTLVYADTTQPATASDGSDGGMAKGGDIADDHAGDIWWTWVRFCARMIGTPGSNVIVEEKTGTNATVTGAVVLSTTQAKFYETSAYFPGASGAGILFPAYAGSGFYVLSPHTIEMWVWPNSGNGTCALMSIYDTTALTEMWVQYTGAGNALTLFAQGTNLGVSTVNMTLDAWNHVELIKTASTTFKLFVNGVQGISAVSALFPTGTTVDFRLSSSVTGSQGGFYGYISMVRFTANTWRYTQNAYTPPTAPFAIYQTQNAADTHNSTFTPGGMVTEGGMGGNAMLDVTYSAGAPVSRFGHGLSLVGGATYVTGPGVGKDTDTAIRLKTNNDGVIFGPISDIPDDAHGYTIDVWIYRAGIEFIRFSLEDSVGYNPAGSAWMTFTSQITGLSLQAGFQNTFNSGTTQAFTIPADQWILVSLVVGAQPNPTAKFMVADVEYTATALTQSYPLNIQPNPRLVVLTSMNQVAGSGQSKIGPIRITPGRLYTGARAQDPFLPYSGDSMDALPLAVYLGEAIATAGAAPSANFITLADNAASGTANTASLAGWRSFSDVTELAAADSAPDTFAGQYTVITESNPASDVWVGENTTSSDVTNAATATATHNRAVFKDGALDDVMNAVDLLTFDSGIVFDGDNAEAASAAVVQNYDTFTWGDIPADSGGDPYWDQVQFLCHCDGPVDVRGHGISFTPGFTSSFSTVAYKFGPTSLLQNANYDTSAIITQQSNDFQTAGDFTIEAFGMIPSFNGATHALFQGWSGNFHGIMVGPSGMAYSQKGDGGMGSFSASGLIVAGQWHHYALARKDGIITLFVDGDVVGTPYADASPTALQLEVGVRNTGGGGGSNWQGYIDEIRMTIGVCRYPAVFAPPVTQFPEYKQTIAATNTAAILSTSYASTATAAATAADAITAFVPVIGNGLEAAAASDLYSVFANFVAAVTEAGAAAETPALLTSTYPVTITEAGAAAGSENAVALFAGVSTAPATAAETSSTSPILLSDNAAAGAAADAPASTYVTATVIAEAAASTEAPNGVLIATTAIANAVTADSTQTNGGVLVSSATETTAAASAHDVSRLVPGDGVALALAAELPGCNAVFYVAALEAGVASGIINWSQITSAAAVEAAIAGAIAMLVGESVLSAERMRVVEQVAKAFISTPGSKIYLFTSPSKIVVLKGDDSLPVN